MFRVGIGEKSLGNLWEEPIMNGIMVYNWSVCMLLGKSSVWLGVFLL